MIKRTVEISNPAYLKTRQKQLVIEQDKNVVAQIPYEDLGVLLISYSQVVITHAVIEDCAQNKIVIVHCDRKYLPVSLTLPMTAHSLHTKTLREQVSITPVRIKQLWQQIVQAKVCEQALTLENLNKNAKPIQALVKKVKSNDSTNIEAQAAQKYWKLLVDKSFTRNPDLEGVNSQLNYGYAIIRAMIARALVVTGFHPSLGLNHSNQYNAYCLADDLMEPFRPWIDEVVMQLPNDEMTIYTKTQLLNVLSQDVFYQEKRQPLMVAVGLLASQLKQAYRDKSIQLDFPKRL